MTVESLIFTTKRGSEPVNFEKTSKAYETKRLYSNHCYGRVGCRFYSRIGKGTRPKKAFKVDSGKARFNAAFTFRQVNRQDVKVSGKDTDKGFSMLEYIGKENAGPPLHIHFSQDEVFYVVEGEYRFVVGGEEMTAKAGDTVFLPRNVPHTWIQLTQSGKMLYVLQPAGSFEEFLTNLQSLTAPPTEEELQKIHLAHEMKVLGPPLTL